MKKRTTLELSKNPSCKAYVQHGFIPKDENNSQIFGICPFCGREDNPFYVNKTTKQWDCKSCGKRGGFKIFLKDMVDLCKDNFKGKIAIDLSKKRNIKISTLKIFNTGYNYITGNYCFPLYYADGQLIDIRIYDGKKMKSTAGCSLCLIGLIKSLPDNIYICEGEFDTMIMQEIIWNLNINGIALGITGANVFKGDWQLYFKRKDVTVILDNDKAGKEGSIRIFNIIAKVVNNIKFVRWNDNKKKGYDLGDLFKDFKKKYDKTYNYILKILHKYPKGVDSEEDLENNKYDDTGEYEKITPIEHKFTYDGEGIKSEEVYKMYKKYLHLPTTDIIDFLYGSIIANRLNGIPVWSFIVAPSGFIKTTFIKSISGSQDIHEEDNMSSAGLVSGFTGGNKKGEHDTTIDNSLLPELNGMTLAIQDLTSLLTDRPENKAKTFGILRSCFDGSYKHRFGNIKRVYESKFGLIAGVTPDGLNIFNDDKALGERFISFEMKLPKEVKDEVTFIMRAMDNATHENTIKEALNKIGTDCLNYDFIGNIKDVSISEKINKRIAYLSLFISIMRGKVEYDKYTKEIFRKAQREIATRLSKQLVKLLKGICLFRRKSKATIEEYKILKKVAISSIPEERHDLVYACYKNSTDGKYTPRVMTTLSGIRLSSTVCAINARKLSMLDVFISHKNKYEDYGEFSFNSDFVNIIKECKIY